MAEENVKIEEKKTEDNKPEEETDKTKIQKSKKRSVAKKSTKKKELVVIVKSKRKAAIARANIRTGKGLVRINNKPLEVIEPREIRMFIMDPMNLSDTTKNASKGVDIDIKVNGGGVMAQAEAVRGAIARSLSQFSNNDIIRKEYLKYDRSLLVDDPRRVEPKKYMGTKARARFQTSYR